MSRNLPHVKLNTLKQKEEPVVLNFKYGFGEEKEGEEMKVEPDYSGMVEVFKQNLAKLGTDIKNRRNERNPHLNVPIHIEYIQIEFQGQFSLKEFFQRWRNTFGLEAVLVKEFGTVVLFAVIDDLLVRTFTENIQLFIDKETGVDVSAKYLPYLLYVKSFQLLTSEDIYSTQEVEPLVNFRLANIPLESEKRNEIISALRQYLEDNELYYILDEAVGNLEIIDADEHQLLEIVQNYDVVLQVTSSLATVVSPGEFNILERNYGFEVEKPADNLPIIAIIDTGIDVRTPLAPIILVDEELNLTSTSVGHDNIDSGRGHGTAVGALAALGKAPYLNNYRGVMSADAKLLSIKIMDENSAYLSQHAILEKIYLAKRKYPHLKIFVLTIGYQRHKSYNEIYSTYAYALDKFAYENDCLVFISTGNNSDAALENVNYNLNYFQHERTNICTPAESMNNLTIGAASHSLREGDHIGISTSKEYPTIYTRKSHIDFSKLESTAKKNKRLFKPDVIECGGDYSFSARGYLNDLSQAGMEVLSANQTESFYTQMGTSFSAPLVANIAAKIQRQYKDLNAASIKALIVNSANNNLIRIEDEQIKSSLIGHGLVDEHGAVFSSNNRVTLVLEETINSDEVKVFPLNFPKYLIEDDLKKVNGILYLTATLCFQFMPDLQNQQGYCPLHMAFGVFRNHTGDQIQLTKEELVSTIKKNGNIWSQNGRDIEKPVPYANVQKISLPINRSELLDEDSTFKIAVHCRVHPQLLPGEETKYLTGNPFSIALTLEEKLPKDRLTGKLYEHLLAVNKTTAIATLFGGAEAIVEA